MENEACGVGLDETLRGKQTEENTEVVKDESEDNEDEDTNENEYLKRTCQSAEKKEEGLVCTTWHPLLALNDDKTKDDIENDDVDDQKSESVVKEKEKEEVNIVLSCNDGKSSHKLQKEEDEEKLESLTQTSVLDVPQGASSNKTVDENKKSPLIKLAEKGMTVADVLSDSGQFAYMSLVAVALACLFDDDWHKVWKNNFMKLLCRHLKVQRKLQNTMLQFLHEDLTPLHAEAYVAILKDDAIISDSPSIVAQDLLGITMQTGVYDARARVIIHHIASLMSVPKDDIVYFEGIIVDSFIEEEIIKTEEQKAEKEKRSKRTKVKRYLAIGVATLGGGALIGLTGGLAAPLVATAGVALFGSGVAFLGTTAGLAIMASMFGAAGAGLGGYKMKRRVGAVEEFRFDSLSDGKDLQIVIAVSGWLTKDRPDNFSRPWLALAESKEQYCLTWESQYLESLGDSLEYIMGSVMTMATKEALKYTVLAGLLAAITLPAAAYGALSAIDNPWSIVTGRSVGTGKELAEALLSRVQGRRPVTLIGFSMGARVIFSALQELSVRKGCEGIVENVVLLGAPVTSNVKKWLPLARVVSGRIINGYCRGDWLLQFVYRAASVQVTNIAGLGPVKWDSRMMENIDLTDIVDGHLDYSEKIDEILQHIGLKTKERDTSTLIEPMESSNKTMESSGNETPVYKVDVNDLLIPQSRGVTDRVGCPRSESADSFFIMKSDTTQDINISASFDSCPQSHLSTATVAQNEMKSNTPTD